MKTALGLVGFFLLILASALPTALAAANVNVQKPITESCLDEINKKRRTVGKSGQFPPLVAVTQGTLSIQDHDIKTKICSGNDPAGEAISANVLFFAESATQEVTSCAMAVAEWEKVGLAAIKDGNPVAYNKATPAPFYKNLLNVGFVGMLFGRHIVKSGSGKIKCASFDCLMTTTAPAVRSSTAFSVVCELVTEPNSVIKDDSQVWSEDEYKLISGVEEITSVSFVVAAIGIFAAYSL